MDETTSQKARRKLSFVPTRQSHQPSFSQFHANNHSSDYLQLAINNLNQLIKESEQQIFQEQQSIINEENQKLTQIQNLQNDITHVQTNIDSLNNEIEKLTLGTYDTLVRQSEGALIRHNQVLRESIEHINHVLRKRSIANDASLEQLKKDLTNQQEKLFLIRNQLDIDHNKLATNMSILRECQEQRNQLEKIKIKKQVDLQTIQHVQGDDVEKQLNLQKLQISIEQQTRVRDEIHQLEQYIEPRKYSRRDRDQLSERNEIKQELDLTNDRLLEVVNEIDEDIVEANERQSKHPDYTYNYSFTKLKQYPEKNDEQE